MTPGPSVDIHELLLPRTLDAFDEHVSARDAIQREATPAAFAREEAAFCRAGVLAAKIVSLDLPRGMKGLEALALALTVKHERCLDEGDDVHSDLRSIIMAVLAVAGGALPAGHAGFSEREH
ncbi:hypothetical protein [Methylobacterium sp. Leaf117]|uniref:hypothetical protein n=1 Tax=Methylobacterium sp. Leaf117 TaxID=1736260 RepID=UPI0006F27EBD|nr:hypothetical protein [Methylobacterium sp. Leaf117]KQP91543.1 hypothetical protein ASF57_23010 [Methylobacterium sp. Leaf117]